MPGRTIAIGDIHGCSTALAALADAIDPQPDDTLVTLGDYVNKGPDSKGVLDFLLKLESCCQLVPLLGNHDAIMLGVMEGRLAFEGWKAVGGTAALRSYGNPEQLDGIPRRHADFLRRCRLWYETPTHIFVHASYDPQRSLDAQDEWILLIQGIRDEIPDSHLSGKVAIVGHTSQKDGEILDAGHLVCIDTNCWDGGWLTAMDVEDRTVWQVDERGRSRGRGH